VRAVALTSILTAHQSESRFLSHETYFVRDVSASEETALSPPNFVAPLERAHRDRGSEAGSLAGCSLQQVLRLASPLRQSQRTQSLDPSRLLAGRAGEAGDHRFPRALPPGRLSAADLHDAGRRRGSREPGERMASPAPSGPIGALEKQAVEQGEGLPAAAGPHQHWHGDISYVNEHLPA
jgi:hypothetical protein